MCIQERDYGVFSGQELDLCGQRWDQCVMSICLFHTVAYYDTVLVGVPIMNTIITSNVGAYVFIGKNCVIIRLCNRPYSSPLDPIFAHTIVSFLYTEGLSVE